MLLENLNIIKKHVTVSRRTRPGIKREANKGVVVHYVGLAGAKAINARNWLESLKDVIKPVVSWHYTIGLDGEIIESVPFEEVAWASGGRTYKAGILKRLGGNVNKRTVSIETCHTDKAGNYTVETYDSFVKLTAALLTKMGLDTNHLYRHYDITGKVCPRLFVDHPTEWTKFKARVQALL